MADKLISVVLPVRLDHEWQLHMTIDAIRTLRCTTESKFELIVVETVSKKNPDTIFGNGNALAKSNGIDTWLMGNCGSYSADWNLGADRATGDLLLHTGNDVFTRPDWVDLLHQCFRFEDCGAATILSSDISPHVKVSPNANQLIHEGIYGPFMAFRKEWRLDADNFPNCFSDTDLIMRMYSEGYRSYRNHGGMIHHLNRQTLDGDEHQGNFDKGREAFIRIHGGSPHFAYRALSDGLAF